MKNFIFYLTNFTIKLLFYFLLILTFYFALTSVNLIVGDNKYFGMSTTIVTTIFILVALFIAVIILSFKKIGIFLKYIFWDKRLVTSLIMIILVLVLQLLFVYYVHPAIGFDVGAIHNALSETQSAETKAYYSMYPNNMYILLLQHLIVTHFHNQTWLFFDMITILLVDLSALCNLISVYLLNKRYIVGAIYIHSLWLLTFPMIIIPYTDTWVIPFVSGYLLCFCIIEFGKCKNIYKYFATALFGISLASAYYMKPSSVIPAIAIVIIQIIFILKPSNMILKNKIQKILLYFSLILFTLLSFGAVRNFVQKQKYIEVDPNRSVPVLHFMNMGLSGDGGYNPKDALMMGKLRTKQERIEYSKEKIKERLRDKGFFGYIKFLLKKDSNDTSDGSFSWQKEGHFVAKEKQTVKVTDLTSTIKSFVYLYGEHISDFRFIAQIVWVVILALILLGDTENIKFKQILRLGIIGGIIYLLLFEGGRSRYMIQFLPVILILSSLSSIKALKNIKNIFIENSIKI